MKSSRKSNGAVDKMVLIDSNIWIFSENDNAGEHVRARTILERHVNNEFFLNIITISETFHKLSILVGKEEAHKRVPHIFDNPNATWLDFTADTMKKALDLAFKNGIRINDALIAQQALELNIPVLTDNVKDFKKVHGLKIIPLREA